MKSIFVQVDETLRQKLGSRDELGFALFGVVTEDGLPDTPGATPLGVPVFTVPGVTEEGLPLVLPPAGNNPLNDVQEAG